MRSCGAREVGKRLVQAVEVVVERRFGIGGPGRRALQHLARIENEVIVRRSRRQVVSFRLAGGAGDRLGRTAKKLLDPGDQQLRLEGFGQHAVTPDLPGASLVHGLERSRQEEDGNVRQVRVVLDERGYLVAVAARHPDVGEHDVRRLGRNPVDRLLAVAHRRHADVLVGEGQLDDPLNRDAVVCEQESVRHEPPDGNEFTVLYRPLGRAASNPPLPLR